MKKSCILAVSWLFATVGYVFGGDAAPAPNGLEFPGDYLDWRVLGPSHREDNKTLRVILGNDVAVRSAREGRTAPWPDGTILGKAVWKESRHPAWEQAVVPGEVVHVEFMVKDAAKYPETGGWGFGRWLGIEKKPYGKDASFAQECFGCHRAVEESDWVFTHQARLP